MSRQSARSTTELFTLTYGSLVANIVKDFGTDAEINEQLDRIGFNMGLRLVEDYLARGNPGRCNDFRETANALAKVSIPYHLLLLERKLVISNNLCPVTPDRFVDLPPEHPKLFYSNVLAGAIRGALHNVSFTYYAPIDILNWGRLCTSELPSDALCCSG
ncbi:unnamed protein product [Echinostoma caproni]|uniref:Trafficking protein particle complex subunit n=1 Tax=Echinostoma caproni TaxID=27848 RepID=A0A183AYL1_9TREM|nr:unnamed protein product [Echinostoma caproni]